MRFEDHLERFQEEARQRHEHVVAGERSWRAARRLAYKQAQSAMVMLEEDRDRLAAKIKPLTVEEWLDESFAPLKVMGDSYESLMAAIKRGVTLDEYVNAPIKLEPEKQDE